MRECGLKSVWQSDGIHPIASLPLRECGLKLIYSVIVNVMEQVTPLAGVWIEISDNLAHTIE